MLLIYLLIPLLITWWAYREPTHKREMGIKNRFAFITRRMGRRGRKWD